MCEAYASKRVAWRQSTYDCPASDPLASQLRAPPMSGPILSASRSGRVHCAGRECGQDGADQHRQTEDCCKRLRPDDRHQQAHSRNRHRQVRFHRLQRIFRDDEVSGEILMGVVLCSGCSISRLSTVSRARSACCTAKLRLNSMAATGQARP